MAGKGNSQQKTEQPTPRRLQEARRKGQVARSTDLNGALILLGAVLYFYIARDNFLMSLKGFLSQYLSQSLKVLPQDSLGVPLYNASIYFLGLVAPILVLTVLVALLSNIGQVGFIFSTEALRFKFDKIDPAQGIQRLFSAKAFAELGKTLLKVVILGAVVSWLVKKYLDDILVVGQGNPAHILYEVTQFILLILGNGGIAYLILALLDYLHKRYQHQQELRMSKEELKEEMKQSEGDPHLKARLRELQRQISSNNMIREVPRATVVVTNPIHLAVALRYEKDKNEAPLVVAKGAGQMAERIKQSARENGVPLMENVEVARFLYRHTEPGDEIPVEVYQAVAEILALVYRLNNRKKSRFE
jgi:flagellar biosynthetic protein FlhB